MSGLILHNRSVSVPIRFATRAVFLLQFAVFLGLILPSFCETTVIMAKFTLTPISTQLDCGTRIHWDAQTKNLYYVDLPNCLFFKHNIKTGDIKSVKVGNETLTFMFPVEGSNTKFLAGINRKIVFVEWDGASLNPSNIETIAEVDTDEGFRDNRINGGKVDPWGRLWAGTMGPSGLNGEVIPEKGSLYSLEKGVLKKHETQVGISNGLAWNVQKMKMYYVDTLIPAVFQYDIDASGNISNKKKIFSFIENNIKGSPDGMTIDIDGNLWVTAIFGSVIFQFNPDTGKLLQVIDIITSQPTSVTFGGDNLDEIYLTTARLPVKGVIPEAPAGATYVIRKSGVNSIGLAGDRYKL